MPIDHNTPDPVESVKGPSVHTDEHGLAKPNPHPSPKFDAEHPGYETTDVNTKGVVVFIGGLMSFLVVFFLLCYVMGKAINGGLLKQDVEQASKNPLSAASPEAIQKRGASLATNPEQEQADAAKIASSFPNPRPPVDDDNAETSDMHAREDLLLEHYTKADASEGPDGTIHIPIEKAMQLIVKRGLPTATTPATAVQTRLTGDTQADVKAPLTTGFARTGYELDQIESRDQKMKLGENPGEKK
jgi:hypothetical protein